MLPTRGDLTAPIPPPASHRAQMRIGPTLHLDALTLLTRLHVLALGQRAVRLAHRRCPPPLPADPGGRPRVYTAASLLLLALLRTLWRRSYQDMRDWLQAWLALACGLPRDAHGQPRVPRPAPQGQRAARAAAPSGEARLVVLGRVARRSRLISARALILESAPILAWQRADPDAATGHAPQPQPRPLLQGYRVHTLLCRGSGVPCSAPARHAAGRGLLGLASDRLDA